MLNEFPIERDNVATFRDALRDAISPDAAREGEVFFLETKVFNADYLAFLEDCATKSSYAPSSREAARRRKLALEPHTGQAILHGGVSHGDVVYNVFVEKLTARMIHFEAIPKASRANG